MFARAKIIMSIIIAVSMIFAPLGASAYSLEEEISKPTVGNTFIDAIVYRPVGLIAIPAGAILFALTIPFSAIGGNVGQSFDNLVATPAKFTFVRPLGDI